VITAGVTGVMAEVFTQIGGAIYNDPRPFVVRHFHPLIAHIADNGFPSDHALLAAFLVVCVLRTRFWRAVPVVTTLAVLVDWVGAGIHHPIDVIGSAVFVALGRSSRLQSPRLCSIDFPTCLTCYPVPSRSPNGDVLPTPTVDRTPPEI
jgi:undecaprenyl-diphosphatase